MGRNCRYNNRQSNASIVQKNKRKTRLYCMTAFFVYLDSATTIECCYKPFRAQFERIACPVAQILNISNTIKTLIRMSYMLKEKSRVSPCFLPDRKSLFCKPDLFEMASMLSFYHTLLLYCYHLFPILDDLQN